MRQRIRKAWSAYRHAAAVKGLLEALGMWKWIALGGAIVVSATVAWFAVIPLWLKVIVGLASAALVLLVVGGAVALCRVCGWQESTAGLDGTTDIRGKPKAAEDRTPLPGPELVIKYAYEDRHRPWPPLETNNRPDAPLVICNVSTSYAAYNVRVLPLTIEGDTMVFRPSVVPCIESKGQAEVFANIPGSSLLFAKHFPSFFRKSFRNASISEVTEDKIFELTIEYDDGCDPATQYESRCQLTYRYWKDRIGMINVQRRLRSRMA